MTDARFQDEIMSRLPLDMGDSDVLMIAGAFGWSSEFMAKATSKRSLAKAAVKSSGHIGNLLAKAAPPPPKALATTMIPAAVFATSPKAVRLQRRLRQLCQLLPRPLRPGHQWSTRRPHPARQRHPLHVSAWVRQWMQQLNLPVVLSPTRLQVDQLLKVNQVRVEQLLSHQLLGLWLAQYVPFVMK